MVWLGPRAGGAERFNSAASQRVLGGGVVRVWRSPDAGNFLAPAALDHPLLAAFRRVGDGQGRRKQVQFVHVADLVNVPADQ